MTGLVEAINAWLAESPTHRQTLYELIADHFYEDGSVKFEWASAAEAPPLEELPEHPGKHYCVVTFEWQAVTDRAKGNGELPGTDDLDEAIPMWITAEVGDQGPGTIRVTHLEPALHAEEADTEW